MVEKEVSAMLSLQKDHSFGEILLVQTRHIVQSLQAAWSHGEGIKNKVWTQKSQQHNVQAQTADGNHAKEEQVLTTSCFTSRSRVAKGRLIDSGYTNHMTSDESIFRKIDKSCISKVRIENGELIQARAKGDVLINTPSSTKVNKNVLLVPEIDHNLLSIG